LLSIELEGEAEQSGIAAAASFPVGTILQTANP